MSPEGGRSGPRGSRGARGRPRPFLESCLPRVPTHEGTIWEPFWDRFGTRSVNFAGCSLPDFRSISRCVFTLFLYTLSSPIRVHFRLENRPRGCSGAKTRFEISLKSCIENQAKLTEIVPKRLPNGSQMVPSWVGTRARQDSKNCLGRPRAPRDPLGPDRPPPGLILDG